MRFPEHDREQEDPPCPTCSVERFGGHSGGETPGLIPNPEVKPSSADGTAPETVWESRTPPDINMTERAAWTGGPFCVVGHNEHSRPCASDPSSAPASRGVAPRPCRLRL